MDFPMVAETTELMSDMHNAPLMEAAPLVGEGLDSTEVSPFSMENLIGAGDGAGRKTVEPLKRVRVRSERSRAVFWAVLLAILLGGAVGFVWWNAATVDAQGEKAIRELEEFRRQLDAIPIGPAKEPARYQGRTAAAWGRDVLDADPAVSYEAAFALFNLGEDAAPYQVRALKDGPWHSKKYVLQFSGDGKRFKAYDKELTPILRRFLDDNELAPHAERILSAIRADARIKP